MLPDAAAGGLDQHVVPRANLRLRDQAVPSRVGRDGQRGGFGEVHTAGNNVGVDGRGRDVFGMAAVQVYA